MNTPFNFVAVLLVASLAISCTVSKETAESVRSESRSDFFALPQQKAPPNEIQSIQLYPKDRPDLPPVVKLHSQQQLVLAFDYLGEQSRQFKVEISHRTQQWEQSPISPSTYLDSFFQAYIQDSRSSFSQRPSYHHVEYAFPNSELQPAVSGNYLLEVYSYTNGELLFSMPFLITEDKGDIETAVETVFAQRRDGRPLDQLYSTYRYPDIVEFPQFDLSVSFVQNQFWGRMREADFLDTITPGEINGRMSQSKGFIGNYEFKVLDLRTFNVDGRQILDYQPEYTPPRIILRRDLQHLDTNPRYYPFSGFGHPLDDRSSNYAQVEFSFETDTTITPSAGIYIVGDFNNWMINDLNKMTYKAEERLWRGSALIKQGEYAYKYVLVEDNRINDLALDQGFLSSQQEYLTIIYFKDPTQNFDRILKVDRITGK